MAEMILHALQPGLISDGLRMKCGLRATKRTSKRHGLAGNPAAATCVACAAVVRAELEVERMKRGPVHPGLEKYREWADGPDSGTSSKTIVQVLTGAVSMPSYNMSAPRDPSDFGRCYRMLKLFPELRERLPEVASACPEWSGLVGAWAELEALWEQESPSGKCPALYDRMKALLSGSS